MADHTIDSLQIDITSDSKAATQAIGKLISALKTLKKEVSSGFNNSGLTTALKSLDKVDNKLKDISKDSSLKKVSENLKKATEIKTDSLDKFKASLRGLQANAKIPHTFAEIEKEINSLLPKYEKLIDSQRKAISLNKGEEPNTKAYKSLLYDIEMLLAKQKELSRARLKMSKDDASREEKFKGVNIPDDKIRGANNSPDTLRKLSEDYDKVAESAKKASDEANNFNQNFKVDDPSERLREFVEGQKQLTDRLNDIREKAKANVNENFLIPESIKQSESALNSLLSRLSAVKESLQQAFDLDRIEEGSRSWETYQYKIAAVEEKIEETTKSLKKLTEKNKSIDATEQFSKNQEQSAKKVSEIWQKAYDNIQKTFHSPETLKELEKTIPTLEKNLAKLYENFQKDIDTGKVDKYSKAWTDYEYKIGMANAKLDITREKLEKILALEKEMEQTEPIPEVEKSSAEPTTKGTSDVTTKAMAATVSFATLSKMVNKFSSTLDNLSGRMASILNSLYAPLRHVVAEYKEKLGHIGDIFKKLGSVADKVTDKIRVKWNNLVHSFSKMVMRRALYAVLTTFRDAMGSLANFAGMTGQRFNKAMSEMTASARYTGASIVAAFSPLVTAIAPIIDALIEKLVSAITVINQFFSALTGNNVYVKAKKVVLDYADSVKKAEKAQKDLVLGIDELNINNPDKNNAGGEESAFPGYEWEEIPVENKIRDFANKVKDIFSKLFDPLKKAWDRAGKYVVDGFKYMVGELGKLASDIGRDFLKMWNEEETIKIFENILGIIGDIEYTIGNLARNFREAWNENNVGLEIFRNMRDIIGILVQHVRNVTKYMKEWSETINFKPLLNTFNDLLASLKPVADFLGGVFEDIMERVVLRHIKWLIEEGIPHLNETLASIADAFDWEKLRTDLQPVEDAFANLAEVIHTGVTNAIGNLGQALAGITNTETFTKFMENIARIINLVDAELVEKVLTALGNCILDVVNALVNFGGSETFTAFLEDVKKFLDGITVEDIEGIIKGLAIAIGTFEFAKFAGKGLTGFLNLMTVLASIGNLGGAEGTLTGVATAISNIGTALSAGVGISLITKHYIGEITKFKDDIKEQDVPGAITSAFEIVNVESTTQTLEQEVRSILEGVDFPGKVDKIVSYFTGDNNSLYSRLWQFVYHDLPELFDFSGKTLDHVVKVATGQSKSLRDLVDENVRGDSDALRDLREVTVSETSTMSEKYDALKNNISEAFNKTKEKAGESLSNLWSDVKENWNSIKNTILEKLGLIETDIDSSSNSVKKIFSENQEEIMKFAKDTWDSVKETVGGAYDYITDLKWSDISSAFSDALSSLSKTASEIWGDIEDTFEDAINYLKGLFDFEWHFPHIELPHFRIDGDFDIWEGRFPRISVDWYANGGFIGMPHSYSLFGAGENGIPEILGTVGGRNAVAGGEEITGIRDQVYESGIAEQQLLNQAIGLLQVIADKNFSVDLDGRSMVSAINNRSTRNGYSMATIS